jgi:hydrogenase/urease accessory protein HupE
MANVISGLDADGDGVLTEAEVGKSRAGFEQSIVSRVVVTNDGLPCEGKLVDARLFEEDGLAIRGQFSCKRDAGRVHVDLPLLSDLAMGHRHIAMASHASKTVDAVLSSRSTSFEIGEALPPPSTLEVFGQMLVLGIEHILFGYDHLVFLLGLVLVGGSWRSLLMVITAFTVGHSITLGLAVLGIVVPSPRFIEPAIALSIAYVGVENYFVKDADKRWRITLPFGLIHGFGFAGALGEVALPSQSVPLTLLSFNLGVELGQLAIMAVVLPLVLYARKQDWFANVGVKALSGAIALAGMFWFVTRVVS